MRLADVLRAVLLLGLVGCTSSDKHLKPEPPAHEYTTPPDEPRYNGPITYPPGTLNQDIHLEQIQNGFKKPDPGLKKPGMMGGP